MLILLFLLTGVGDTLELSLSQALERALRLSPTAVEAQASRCASSIKLAQGITGLLPVPSASISRDRIQTRLSLLPDSTISKTSWSGSLTLNQVVFDPQVFAGVASAVVYSGYYAADAQDKKARLVYEVTRDYLAVLGAWLLRDAAASALDRAEDNLKLTQEKLRLGSASPLDVMRSRAFRSQAEVNLLSAEKALAMAQTTFLATAGITDDIVVKPTEQLSEPAGFAVQNRDSLIAAIVRSNPGVRLAASSAVASQLNQAAAVARALPSVSLYWTSTYADTSFPSSYTHWKDRDDVACGIRFSFPLLDVKSYVLGIAEASTETRRARAGAARARLSVRSTAAAAVLGYEEARQRYDYARRNLELNQELYRLAQEQQRLGAISLLDFFSVQTGLSQAQAAYISALNDTYVQAAQISYLLGRTEQGPVGK
ncbi:MAG: TolC family protein [candidate division WOR-3 bacterium]